MPRAVRSSRKAGRPAPRGNCVDCVWMRARRDGKVGSSATTSLGNCAAAAGGDSTLQGNPRAVAPMSAPTGTVFVSAPRASLCFHRACCLPNRPHCLAGRTQKR